MAILSKRERVEAALSGQPVDRVPVAAWRHFVAEEVDPEALAQISVGFLEHFDWDWLKVNPRATYYAEAFGSHYDLQDYQGVLPRLVASAADTAESIAALTPRGIDTPALAEHLELLQLISAEIGDVHFIQTLFSPLSVLSFLLAHADDAPGEAGRMQQIARLRELLRDSPAAAHAGLAAITKTLADYAAACLDAGASGLFFAIVRLARADALSTTEYAEFGTPYDIQVLQAVREAPFNLLHLCGPQAYFDITASYPVHAINWATVGQGNPSLAAARALTEKALIGGIDEEQTMLHGSAAQVTAAARAALAEAGTRRILLAPGCAVAPETPEANMHALRAAVERHE